MARFTKIMGLTAILGVILGGGSVILIYLTLRATQKMSEETKLIGKDQSRAYLHVEKVDFFWGSEAMDRPLFRAEILNSGSTPAKWYKIRTSVLVFEHGESGVDGFPENWTEVQIPEDFRGPWFV